MAKETAEHKKKEFDRSANAAEEAEFQKTEKTHDAERAHGLAVRQLWMVTDKKSERYGQNWRVLAFVEGNEGEEAKVKFQFQIPLGPGKPAESATACPNCGAKFPHGAILPIPATKQTDEINQTKFLTEAQLRKEWKTAGATMVEAGQVEV
jgi:hypothetical protein